MSDLGKVGKAYVEITAKGEGGKPLDADTKQKADKSKGIWEKFFKALRTGRWEGFSASAEAAGQTGIGPAAAALATGGGVKGFAGSLGGAGGAGLSLAMGLGGTAAGLGASAMYSAGVANPIAMENFKRAWMDLIAVIGQNFVPLLRDVTAMVRRLADITLNADSVGQAFDMASGKSKREALEKEVREKEAYNAKLIFGPGTHEKESLEESKRRLAEFMAQGGKEKSSVGLSDFRTPSMTGIADAKNAFITEALRVSSGGGAKPEEETAENTRKIVQLMEAGNAAGAGAVAGAALGVPGNKPERENVTPAG